MGSPQNRESVRSGALHVSVEGVPFQSLVFLNDGACIWEPLDTRFICRSRRLSVQHTPTRRKVMRTSLCHFDASFDGNVKDIDGVVVIESSIER